MAKHVNATFECEKCGERFKPTLAEYISLQAVHTPNKRYLKCPNCNKRSMTKRVRLPGENKIL